MNKRNSFGARRRTQVVILLPLLLIGAWYGGKAIVRAHVANVIQASAGKQLPAFELKDQSGQVWSSERVRGKPLLLHFFRSRCHSCDIEAPEFRQLEEQLPVEKATILHVMTDAVLGFPEAETLATIEEKQFQRPVLVADQAFVDAFHTVQWSQVTPVTYFVNADGEVLGAWRGKQTAASLRAALQAGAVLPQ